MKWLSDLRARWNRYRYGECRECHAPMPYQSSGKQCDDCWTKEWDAKKEQKTKRASLAVTFTIIGLLAGTGIWFATSESARAKAGYVVKSIRECGQDVKGVASIMGTYEKQLDKVAVQGSRIDAAASALGVDPTTTDTSAQAAEIESQMKEMSGDEGPTVSERDKALQAKFGIVSKLAGNKNPQVQKSESDVKF